LSALLTASAFNGLGQYVSSPGNRAYCYARLAISSVAVAVTLRSQLEALRELKPQPRAGFYSWLSEYCKNAILQKKIKICSLTCKQRNRQTEEKTSFLRPNVAE